MRSVFAILVLIFLCLAAAGWYYAWYTVRRAPAAPGQDKIEIEINKDKARADIRHGEDKAREAFDKTTRKLENIRATGATNKEPSTGR
jgi:hypothetical protein